MKNTKIKSLEELKQLSTDNTIDCYILLDGGIKSSKQIRYDKDDGWYIFNELDETLDTYKTDKELKKNYPFFIDAIKKGCLYKYNWS